MVYLTTIGNKQFVLNSEHIEKLEEVPETLITLTNGKKYLVLETPEEVIEKVILFKKKIYNRGC